MRIHEDQVGAHYEIDLPDTGVGRDLATNLRRGDIIGSSFAFQVAKGGDTWTETSDGRLLRTITNIDWIRDVSPVTFPAYRATEAAMRSLGAAVQLPDTFLRHCADQGHLQRTVAPLLDPRRLLPRGAPHGRHPASFVR